jgi:hypothetical protein
MMNEGIVVITSLVSQAINAAFTTIVIMISRSNFEFYSTPTTGHYLRRTTYEKGV